MAAGHGISPPVNPKATIWPVVTSRVRRPDREQVPVRARREREQTPGRERLGRREALGGERKSDESDGEQITHAQQHDPLELPEVKASQ